MKRCWIYLLFMFVGALGWAYDWDTNPGNGSAANPYQISDPNHLIALGTDTAICTGGYHFILTGDIIFDPDNDPNHMFTDAVIDSFSGVLDGRGYFIENLTIVSNEQNLNRVGLFGEMSEDSVVRHIGMVNTIISLRLGIDSSSTMIGAICGENNGLIERCMGFGIIRGGLMVGGLVGVNYGQIADCYAVGLVGGSSSVGGVTGTLGFFSGSGQMYRCYSTVQMDTTASKSGALVGQYFSGPFTDCAWDRNSTDIKQAYVICVSDCDETEIERIYQYNSEQMKIKSNFSFLDFQTDPNTGEPETWRMCVDGVSPPRLGWEFFTRGDFTCPDGTALEDFSTLSSCFLASLHIDAELDDDQDQIVNLNEMARIGMYWLKTECGCPGADLTGDGMVDISDLIEVIDVWLAVERPECKVADINHDGILDLADLVRFSAFWLD